MRKVIGGILILVVIGGFIWMSVGKNEEKQVDSSSPQTETIKDAQTEIKSVAQRLEKDYPDKAKDLVAINNEMMGACYKYPMSETDIKNYVATIRKIYSEGFKEINSEVNQIEALKKELEIMKKEQMELVVSEIAEIYIAQDDKGDEVSAEVNVSHVTNQGSVHRTYLLIKEDGLWKINGWENLEPKQQQAAPNN